MQIKVTGKNLDIGDALRGHVGGKLEAIAEKFFDGATRAHVTVEKERGRFVSDCTLHLATGLVLQAHGADSDAFTSFDAASAHLERQLRRYKRRLKDHHKSRSGPLKQQPAASYVIAPAPTAEEEEPADLNPVVIAESSAQVPEISVGEAVMQLDISTVPFVLFRNARDGGLNVVYRRPDGNIGWVDPGPSKQA